ncbi:hypothetical protein BT96DRAFT_1007901 [Gymnopus androsaceus JB14]|uniref:Uncharacterized protein n=1 Tax=Gymnopus androsaceus JB14 TaxID=1447944 RepID=A0A6A4GGA2_9AGAR|nr:hypothetical protein BT96DRAFT_1007901 [Gymnopus androsaceus JB14]
MLKHKPSVTGNTIQNQKKRTIIQSDDGTGTDSGDGKQDAIQPTNHNGDDEIVDTTKAKNTKRAEAITKIKKDLAKQKAPIYTFFDAKPEFEFDSEGSVEYLIWG